MPGLFVALPSIALLAISRDLRHIAAWESDGRGTRQSGQILTEAATTNSLRVIRLLFSDIFGGIARPVRFLIV
jgi:hypothetical protein